MDKDKQILLKQVPHNVNELYNKYGGMLYGYIFEIVKDEKLASEHLVAIYSSLPAHINSSGADGTNMWCQLRQLAQKQLSVLDGNTKGDKQTIAATNAYNIPNKFLGLMTDVQKQVFCNVYYNTKSMAMLASELHISEKLRKADIKRSL